MTLDSTQIDSLILMSYFTNDRNQQGHDPWLNALTFTLLIQYRYLSPNSFFNYNSLAIFSRNA